MTGAHFKLDLIILINVAWVNCVQKFTKAEGRKMFLYISYWNASIYRYRPVHLGHASCTFVYSVSNIELFCALGKHLIYKETEPVNIVGRCKQ